jgi:hypothetical protein
LCDPDQAVVLPAEEDEKESTSSSPDVPRSSKIGPAASLLLQGAGMSKEDVTPSGPGGIITKGDVMKAIAGVATLRLFKAVSEAGYGA